MKKFLAMALALAFLFSGVTVQAAKKDSQIKPLRPVVAAGSKLTNEASGQKGKLGKQEYLIQFNTELDLAKTSSAATTAQGLAGKKARGQAVVSALKKDAEKAQKPFIEKLKQENIEFESFFVVNMMWVKASYDKVAKLAEDPSVARVYLNQEIRSVPIKPEKKVQASAAAVQWNVAKVKADQVWQQGFDGSGIVVGIIDSGVDWTHPALKSRFRAYDPVSKGLDSAKLKASWYDAVGSGSSPYDDFGHGTHVTGTILGKTAALAIGVAPGASWIAAKALNAQGAGDGHALLSAGQWMLAPQGNAALAPDIINNSWGSDDLVDDWYRNMVISWRQAGIIPIFSAGNQKPEEEAPWPGSITNPGHYPESFAVAALTSSNALASFSKLGPSPYDPLIIKPDIAAPGVDVNSALPGGSFGDNSGTSMAAPHIAGVAALLLSANGNLSVAEVLFAMQQTAVPLTNAVYPKSPNMGFGYGLVDAKAALELSRNGLPKATLRGTVTDVATGAALPGAQISLLDYPAMQPVVSDGAGAYQLDKISSGNVTLRVSHPKYGSVTQKVALKANSFTVLDVALNYAGVQSGQLGYDDGTGENALVYQYGGYGNGYGVAFQPERYGLIKSIRGYFWGLDYPAGTGTAMDLYLYEADENLTPKGIAMAGPLRVKVKRGAWTDFDVTSLNLRTGDPFVAVFKQPFDLAKSPAIGIDNHGLTGNKHNFVYSDYYGVQSLRSSGFTGSLMIRANMEYAMDQVPVINKLSPVNTVAGVHYAKHEIIHVSGDPAGARNIGGLVNGVLKSPAARDGESFGFAAPLEEGENRLSAAIMVDDTPTLRSEEVSVILDSVPPAIQITAPESRTVDHSTLELKGRVEDIYPGSLAINDVPVSLGDQGGFSYSLELARGVNPIRLKAMDLAGNETEQLIEVTCTDPLAEAAILRSFPAENLVLYEGMDGVVFRVEASLSGASATVTLSDGMTLAMMELSPGVYEAGWSVPEGLGWKGVRAAYQVSDGSTELNSVSQGTLTSRKWGLSRIYGSSRYTTAEKISQNTFSQSASVILASGENFPDALVGGLFGTSLEAPVLFTKANELPLATEREMKRLGASQVKILGGTGAVSQGVEDNLKAQGFQVERIAGSSRYSTAAKVAKKTNAAPAMIFLANGENFADAMSIIPIAAKKQGIVLLTKGDTLHASARQALSEYGAKQVVVLGGEKAVGPNVLAELAAMGITAERVSGSNRYSTNIAIYNKYGDTQYKGAIIGNGENFPDALSSGVMAFRFNQPLILVKPTEIPTGTSAYLHQLSLREITVLGYLEAVSEAVYNSLHNYLN